MGDGRRLETLPRDEALRLLGAAPMGRVVFTHRALPAIRPVNHLLEGDQIIIRTQQGSALDQAVGTYEQVVMAYEADAIDPREHVGWSVIVVGRASRLADGQEAARYRRELQPWVAGTLDEIVVISAEIVDGFRLVRDSEMPAA